MSHVEVGAVTLGQSDKTLQLTAILLSFVDTTKELGGPTSKFKLAIEPVEERT